MLVELNGVEEEARKELLEERAKAAKGRIKDKLKQIESAKTVLANLEREYKDLMIAIGEGN